MMQAARRKAAEEIWLTLAELFKYPEDDFLNQLLDGSVDKALHDLFHQAGYDIGEPELKHRASGHADLKHLYACCFLGAIRPYAVPIESVYKVWTTDPSAQVSIAASKGYLMGDSAIHVRHLLEHFGLEIPSEYASMPDHLAILLELAAYFIANRPEADTAIFLADHFDWLDDFQEALVKTDEHDFYSYAVELVKGAVRSEQEQLSSFAPVQENTSDPRQLNRRERHP